MKYCLLIFSAVSDHECSMHVGTLNLTRDHEVDVQVNDTDFRLIHVTFHEKGSHKSKSNGKFLLRHI